MYFCLRHGLIAKIDFSCRCFVPQCDDEADPKIESPWWAEFALPPETSSKKFLTATDGGVSYDSCLVNDVIDAGAGCAASAFNESSAVLCDR